MNGRKHTIRAVAIVATLACITIMLLGGSVIAENRLDLRNKALELLSEELNLPIAILEIRGERVEHLEYLGQDLYTFIIQNRESLARGDDRAIYVTLDSEGRRVNLDELKAQNSAAKKAKYGKLEPALYDHLQTIAPDETVAVDIWMTLEVEARQSPTEEEIETKGWDVIEEEDKVRRKRNEENIRKFAEPIVAQIEATGGKVLYISTDAPTIQALLTRPLIEAITKRDDVRKIFKEAEVYPMLDISARAVRAHAAWSSGYIGNNQLVAIIEPGGIDLDNIYLHGENRLGSCISTGEYHATKVAGVVASTHNTYKGIAHGAVLKGGEACTFDLETGIRPASEWAMAKGAKVLNNSWGANTSGSSNNKSEYHDEIVRINRVTVVDAAGNCNNSLGTPCTNSCEVVSPGIAYNAITVGGFDDHNMESWLEDSMWRCSSHIDPSQGPKKPELVAPAKDIMTTDHYDFACGYLTDGEGRSGTSYAAPHVSSAAALLMERNSQLKTQPDAVKAILMASAIHNIEGDYSFSNRDGAGALVIDQAMKVAGLTYPNKWISQTVYKTDLDPGEEIRYSFNASIDQRVRLVIAWSVNELYVDYPSEPGVKLHFHILEPNETWPEHVTDWDKGNFLVHEFIASKTGTYTLVVHDPTAFNDASTNLAIAWSVSGTEGMQVNNDTDEDGMYDNFELAFGLDPYNSADANYYGLDGDGLTNLTEYFMGTNPSLYDVLYSDVPLQAGATIVRAQHIYELRHAVNALRESAGLTLIDDWIYPSWTDPDLSGKPIKAVHIQELRDYLAPALLARGWIVPLWTDASLSGKAIKSAHLNEIRNAVQ